MKAKTIEEFIKQCKKIHNNKYNYSLVNYKNNKQKIKIICPIHGEFEQRASSHINGLGCKKCSNKLQNIDIDTLIQKSNLLYDYKYDYSLVNYKNANTKVKIICPIHGEFEQLLRHHIKNVGCLCGKTNKKSTCDFIKKAKKIHGNKYDYSLVNYNNNKQKIKIICNEHNLTFETTPSFHLKSKYNCPLCNNRNHRLNKIKKANENRLNDNQISPFFNKKGCLLFDKINKNENIYIQHAMNGGEYYIKKLGYWLDGYDKNNNVAYEYDEKYHFKNGELRQKDITRQKEIESFLKCKFIRIKD